MNHLRIVKKSRVDAGVRLQMTFARVLLGAIESGRCTDDDEALEKIAQAISFLVNAERYIRDPKGVWR